MKAVLSSVVQKLKTLFYVVELYMIKVTSVWIVSAAKSYKKNLLFIRNKHTIKHKINCTDFSNDLFC